MNNANGYGKIGKIFRIFIIQALCMQAYIPRQHMYLEGTDG